MHKEGMWNDIRAFKPSLGTHSPGAFTSLAIQKLSEPCSVELKKVSLRRHDWLNRWQLVINSTFSPSPLPRGWGMDWSSNSCCLGFSVHQPPSWSPLGAASNTQLISTQEDIYYFGGSKDFRSCTQETGKITKSEFHNITSTKRFQTCKRKLV